MKQGVKIGLITFAIAKYAVLDSLMQCRLNLRRAGKIEIRNPHWQQFPSAVAKVTLNKIPLYRTSIVAIDNLVKIHLVSLLFRH
ncbi:Uncharacterised protein [Salmonella enterica subsp. enterica serovar Bovismorbificans]|uniref:Uncharacterized protein n=1 Tax=Salmonella enterica subsp. enterica serovar Bovismorbificans TaxID=58097 RepID=A0A655DEF6_SALET|nr:Uncharacterised protein [Salmonella enterica subsp. enterica serovar Bovismorbificans]CNU58181.1 Uncharacterised protein [Salmonella enterica subsp. enterica serovar Bovismorbificans]CPR40889.1 Uncharacterised protein [Salmonella enterica subsp. enterica serovar Bovismorbificans]